jgi:hypothetical protein
MDVDDLYERIKNGNETEAKELLDNIYKGTMRSCIAAIMARNLSHSLGSHFINIKKYDVDFE